MPGAPRPWSRGDRPPELDGQHFCGDLATFRNGFAAMDYPGLPANDAGIPFCCLGLFAGTEAAVACVGGVFGLGLVIGNAGAVADPTGSFSVMVPMADVEAQGDPSGGGIIGII